GRCDLPEPGRGTHPSRPVARDQRHADPAGAGWQPDPFAGRDVARSTRRRTRATRRRRGWQPGIPMMSPIRSAGAAPVATVSPIGRALLLVALVAAPLAQAADSPADAAARNALKQLVPQARIDIVEQAPLPGFRQVIVGGQIV